MSFTFQNPFVYFNNPANSNPVGLGNLYVGLPDTDPVTPANQVTVFAVQPDGSELAIPQPVRMTAGGVLTYNGTPIQLKLDAEVYAVKVTSSAGAQLLYTARVKTPTDENLRDDLANGTADVGGVTAGDLSRKYGEFVSVMDFDGVLGDGINDDYLGLQAAFDFAKTNKCTLYMPPGTYRITSGLVYDTTAMGFYQGLRLIGDGQKSSVFLCDFGLNSFPFISLTSGANVSDQQQGGEINGVGFTYLSGLASSHCIQYRGTWHQVFKNIDAYNINGAIFKPVNSANDADSSAHVLIQNIRALGAALPFFDSNACRGGITNHHLTQIYAINCGGNDAMIVIDGCVHFKIDMFSVSGAPAVPYYDPAMKGFHIKSTIIGCRTVEILQGELGNSISKGILVNSVQGLKLNGFRLVKRTGELTFETGIEFVDGSAGIHNGVDIDNINLQIDTASPVFTYLKIGTGINERFSAKRPTLTTFASGSVYASFTSDTAKQRMGYLEDQNGRVLFSKALSANIVTLPAPASYTLDMALGSMQRITISAAGAYTITAPVCNSWQEMDLVINNTSAGVITVTFAGFLIVGYIDPAAGATTSARFIRDPNSSAMRQIGGWA